MLHIVGCWLWRIEGWNTLNLLNLKIHFVTLGFVCCCGIANHIGMLEFWLFFLFASTIQQQLILSTLQTMANVQRYATLERQLHK